MSKKLLLSAITALSVMSVHRVRASESWTAASVAAHAACAGAVVYWLKSHYQTRSSDFELYMKSGITLGLYSVYAPSILLFQGALWTRDLCQQLDIKLPGMKSFVPAVAGAAVIGWKTGIVNARPDFTEAVKLIKQAHVDCKMMPEGGKVGLGFAIIAGLGVWSYISSGEPEDVRNQRYS